MKQALSQSKQKDLSHITNLEDLQDEIRKLRISIRQKEEDIEARWNRLPKETLQASIGSIIPVILDNAVASKTFGLMKGAAGLIFGIASKDKSKVRKTLFTVAKQLGLFTALKAVYALWKKK